MAVTTSHALHWLRKREVARFVPRADATLMSRDRRTSSNTLHTDSRCAHRGFLSEWFRVMAHTTDAIEEIMEVLTRRVRVMTLAQIAEEWFSGNATLARSSVATLKAEMLLDSRRVLARHLAELTDPIVAWQPGNTVPDFGNAAYRLKRRWSAAAVPTEIVAATAMARRRFGGYCGGRWPRVAEVSHDVGLASVYLRYRRMRGDQADGWTPEAQLYAEGRGATGRLPDAVIRRRSGSAEFVVEFGGSYQKHKLLAFHHEMSGISYEIW